VSDVTIQVDGRSCSLTGYAPAWLYSLIEHDDALVETRAAIKRGVAGLEVTLPTEERNSLCERLRTVFSGLSPAEISGHDAQQILRLVSIVCAQPADA
jgi:hypothetical protein